MNIDLLRALCEADAIASSEQEVRDILLQHANLCGKEISFDGLGSTLIQLNQSSGPKIMICAHMDEVGFMVRSITREGAVEVIPIGNVRMLARFMQPVCITTQHGKKIHGLLDAELHGAEARNLCVDIGATSAEEVNQCGVRIGDRVTYASDFKVLSPESRIMGKAFDDRLGCFLLIELMYALRSVELDAEIWLVASSSEEVGMRGGKTAAHMIQPDLALILDTACWSKNFDYGAANHRQIGQGPMLVMYDKTLIPSPRLLNFIQDTAQQHSIADRYVQQRRYRWRQRTPLRKRYSNCGTGRANAARPLRRINCGFAGYRTDQAASRCRHPATECRHTPSSNGLFAVARV